MMPKFDVTKKQCPSRNVLEGISGKWSILIISLLAKKTYRFGELKREIGDISQKVLSQTTQRLEKYGLICRQEFNELPLKVEYSLTPIGKELSDILTVLTLWTEDHIPMILQAEQIYTNQLAAKKNIK